VVLRLRVDHDGYPSFNPQRVGAPLVGEIANPNEAVMLAKKKVGNFCLLMFLLLI
jgi:hypothetical protein